MATSKDKMDWGQCAWCIALGVIGATIYFMWADIRKLFGG
jgi:hypothetical protein